LLLKGRFALINWIAGLIVSFSHAKSVQSRMIVINFRNFKGLKSYAQYGGVIFLSFLKWFSKIKKAGLFMPCQNIKPDKLFLKHHTRDYQASYTVSFPKCRFYTRCTFYYFLWHIMQVTGI
jgi:hypothetical protein